MELVQIRLASAHPQAQRSLYAGPLGLDVSEAPGGALAVEIGATRLMLEPGPSSPQHFAIRIPSGAYADGLAWLASRVELLGEGGDRAFAFPDWNADAAYFRDADGNVVELIAHHDLPELHRPPFRPGSMLGVCEVGVPVDDVGEYLESLERRTGARRWSGDGATFAAAGDKRGSLIVVRRGRAWYPTRDAEAMTGPLGIDLGNAGVI